MATTMNRATKFINPPQQTPTCNGMLQRNNCMRYKHKKGKPYPKATVATITFILEEIQSSNTEVRILLFNPA